MRNFGKSKTKSHIDNFRRHGALSLCFFVIVLGIAALGYFSTFSASMAETFEHKCSGCMDEGPYCVPTCDGGYSLSENVCMQTPEDNDPIIHQKYPSNVECKAGPPTGVYYHNNDGCYRKTGSNTYPYACGKITIKSGTQEPVPVACAENYYVAGHDNQNQVASCEQCPNYLMNPDSNNNLQTCSSPNGSTCIQGQSDTNNESGEESCYIIPTDGAGFTDETGSGVFVVDDNSRCYYEEPRPGREVITGNDWFSPAIHSIPNNS